jgi:hypothetical protein
MTESDGATRRAADPRAALQPPRDERPAPTGSSAAARAPECTSYG